MELASVPAARDRIEFLQIQTEWGFLLLPSRGRLQPAARRSRAGAVPPCTARASEPAPSPCGPAGGFKAEAAEAPGLRDPAPGTRPRPHPASPAPGARERGRWHQPPDGTRPRSRGAGRGPGDPPRKNFSGAGPRPPVARYCLRAVLGGGPGRGRRGPGGAGPKAAAQEPGQPEAAAAAGRRAREPSRAGGPRSSAMPAAAGDGLLGEPAAPGGGGGAEDAARPAAACEGSFLPAWVSGVPRERLRDFQHHKRVGNYLIGSRKLGEGSFAKVREGLHVLTGEKVSRPGRGVPGLSGREERRGPRREHCTGSQAAQSRPGPSPPLSPCLSLRVGRGDESIARARPRDRATGLSRGAEWGRLPRGAAGLPTKPPAVFLLLGGRRLVDASAGVGWGGGAAFLRPQRGPGCVEWQESGCCVAWAVPLRVGEPLGHPLGKLRLCFPSWA